MLLRQPIRRHAALRSAGEEVLRAAGRQVAKTVRRAEAQPLAQALVRARAQLVEYVIVALLRVLADHARALQQVVGDVAAGYLAPTIKVDLDKLAKSENQFII